MDCKELLLKKRKRSFIFPLRITNEENDECGEKKRNTMICTVVKTPEVILVANA